MSLIPKRNGTTARPRLASRVRKGTRQPGSLEALEARSLLTVTSITLAGNAATMNISGGNFGASGIIIEADAGNNLEWSQDGGTTFTDDWDTGTLGSQTLPAASTSSVDIDFNDNAQYSLQLGNATGSLAALQARFTVNGNVGAGSTLDLNDAADTNSGAVYNYDGMTGAFGGTLTTVVQNNTPGFAGGVTIHGGDGPDTFDITSVRDTEPVNVNAGPSANTINVGDDFTTPANSSVATIDNTITVSDLAGSATINVNDAGGSDSSDAALDGFDGIADVLSGLDFGPGATLTYVPGSGVVALNVNLGTDGAAGVTAHINVSDLNETVTFNSGANPNTFLLSNPTLTDGLDNLAGPVVVNGGASGEDAVTLDDSSADFSDDYTITPTTVTRNDFGGLKYGNIAALTLIAENSLGTDSGLNNVDINGTADNVATIVATQSGTDTVNVNSTGTGSTLAIDTTGAGDSGSAGFGATVNVVSNNEPVNIFKNAALSPLGDNDDVINIGSTEGAGTLDGIQAPITIRNGPTFFDLNIHDEDGGSRAFTLDNDDLGNTAGIQATGTVIGAPAGTPFVTYRPTDVSSVNVFAGASGNTFNVNNTTAHAPTTLDTGNGSDTVHVLATGDATLTIHGDTNTEGANDSVTLGGNSFGPPGMQGLNGTINVDNDGGFTDLTLDDSQDFIGQLGAITGADVTGLSPATINFTDTDVSSLTVNGGSGGNTFTVDGTLANPGVDPTSTTLNTGTGNDTTFVQATSVGTALDIHGQDGNDAVTIGDFGCTCGIEGAVSVDNSGSYTDLTVDASDGESDHDISLSGEAPATLGGLSPAPITYTVYDLSSLTLDTGPLGNQTLNLDFDDGNPLPYQGFPGLTWNAGADGTSDPNSHVLNLTGTLPWGPFASEVHNAEDDFGPEHQGDITFTDGESGDSSILYTGLQPINDTVAAASYTLNDTAFPDGSFNAVDGPVLGGFTTIQFNSPSPAPNGFETTTIANKTDVVFNANTPLVGVSGTVNITTPSDGLSSLQFNTSNAADNAVSFVNVPAGVATSYNGSTGADTTSVNGVGVPAGNTLTLDGGANTDTLNYDAGGITPTVTAGASPGEIIIDLPGFGTVDATGYETVNITNVGPLSITPGTPQVINTVQGAPLVSAIVGTFTLPLPVIVNNPAGVPASGFTATIDWGDPSPDNAAGAVTQDASNPSVYYITGTHTFAEPGAYTVGTTIGYNGSTVTSTVNGVTVGVTFPPFAPVAGAAATANVSNGSLSVTALPLSGVEGGTIPSAPVATLIDAGGASGNADPASDFAAQIALVDSTGTTVLMVPAASITQLSDTNSYGILAPALSLAGLDEGTYLLRVLVTKSVNGTTAFAVGGATLTVTDAPLTAGAAVALTTSAGAQLPGTTVVGNFTDPYTGAAPTDFTATIDWGDGTAPSLGIVAGTAGTYTVAGGHQYAKPGSYTTTIVVKDDGGSQVTLNGTAAATDEAVVAGAPVTIHGVEGQSTGSVVLGQFTDPNPLATAADVSATLSTWGDGTPAGVVPVAVELIGSGPAGAVFQVVGSHTYLDETPAAGVTIAMTVTTSGGVATPLTATAIIADAALSSNGASVTGTEGVATTPGIIATFTDANPNATLADYTSGGGSVVVAWGDGSTEALPSADLGAAGSPNGVVFSVTSSHLYVEAGTYAITVTATDAGGATTVAHGTAVIGDAPLAATATQPTIGATVGKPFGGAVATFTDGNPAATAADFNDVLIDWGDGSGLSLGTVTGPVGGVFTVNGTHTYGNAAGTLIGLPIRAQVHDVDGATLSIANSTILSGVLGSTTGQITSASVSGLSNGTANVTSDQSPTFNGTVSPAEAGRVVTLTAFNAKGQAFAVGRGVTDAAGDWTVTTGTALPTGTYSIVAVVSSSGGLIPAVLVYTVITPKLVIDTAGPTVQNVEFNRGTGTVYVTYTDAVLSDGSPGSGVSPASLTDAANYQLARRHAPANRYLVTAINPVATGVPGEQEVALTFNNGRVIRGGFNFNFNIFATSAARASGVEDIAENGLQGVFYGTFPSGNGVNGTNFSARLVAFHNRVLPALTNVGNAHPGGALFSARHHSARLHVRPHRRQH